jgi:tRNA threonylcarbamoyladenosine biosynthesis protein TsaE
METIVARSEQDLERVGEEILRRVEANAREGVPAGLILLKGDLGAGKTALTKALARVLHIDNTVNSPTFVLMKTYAIPQHTRFTKLVHIDAYRIEEEDELRPLRFEELLRDPHNLIVVEWPERIEDALPQDVPVTTIAIGEHNERIITYER